MLYLNYGRSTCVHVVIGLSAPFNCTNANLQTQLVIAFCAAVNRNYTVSDVCLFPTELSQEKLKEWNLARK